tara:strand:- start:161 stop:424 length:264 start_codon:yes stop_codon:yes gene_type:complete
MKMENKKHNGWTNYATWRVNLEILDGFDSYDSPEVEPEYLKDYVEEFILMDVDDTSLVASYAMSFLSEVNWHEIAEHINEEQKETAQ